MAAPRRFVLMLAGALVLTQVDAAWACTTKVKAYVAAMRSDLRNLVTAEEAYAAEHGGKFSATLDTNYLRASEGVTLTVELTATGWRATARHASSESVCNWDRERAMAGGDPPCDPDPSQASLMSREAILMCVLVGILLLGAAARSLGGQPRRHIVGPTLLIAGVVVIAGIFVPQDQTCGNALPNVFILGIVSGLLTALVAAVVAGARALVRKAPA